MSFNKLPLEIKRQVFKYLGEYADDDEDFGNYLKVSTLFFTELGQYYYHTIDALRNLPATRVFSNIESIERFGTVYANYVKTINFRDLAPEYIFSDRIAKCENWKQVRVVLGASENDMVVYEWLKKVIQKYDNIEELEVSGFYEESSSILSLLESLPCERINKIELRLDGSRLLNTDLQKSQIGLKELKLTPISSRGYSVNDDTVIFLSRKYRELTHLSMEGVLDLHMPSENVSQMFRQLKSFECVVNFKKFDSLDRKAQNIELFIWYLKNATNLEHLQLVFYTPATDWLPYISEDDFFFPFIKTFTAKFYHVRDTKLLGSLFTKFIKSCSELEQLRVLLDGWKSESNTDQVYAFIIDGHPNLKKFEYFLEDNCRCTNIVPQIIRLGEETAFPKLESVSVYLDSVFDYKEIMGRDDVELFQANKYDI